MSELPSLPSNSVNLAPGDSVETLRKRLEVLQTISASVVGSRGIVEQLQDYCALICSTLEVEACVVRELRDSTLYLVAGYGVPEGQLPLELPADFGIGEHIIGKRVPVSITDTSQSEVTARLIKVGIGFRFVSYAGAPMLVQGEVRGILGVYATTKAREFGESELAFLQTVANQVAVALQNDELYRKLAEVNQDLEAKVQQRTTDLQHMISELDSFCYAVSHDLRAPLRSISGFAQILREDFGGRPLTSEGMEHLVRIELATKRLARLIDDLLKLSRISRGELSIERVDLTPMCRSLVDEISQTFPGVAYKVEMPDRMPVDADPGLINVAMANLLSNALKFSSKTASPLIRLSCQKVDRHHVVTIEDNGAGFASEFAKRLFMPFEREHSEKEFPGNGIGLATVLRIVRRHGGEVTLQGAPGEGTVAKVWLPVVDKRATTKRTERKLEVD